MQDKIRLLSRVQKLVEKQKEQQSQLLLQHRNQRTLYQDKLNTLSQLKQTNHPQQLDSMALQNAANVQLMLNKMERHYASEIAIVESEEQALQNELTRQHARSKGLEMVMERWSRRQQYEQAKADQKLMEDIISARLKRT